MRTIGLALTIISFMLAVSCGESTKPGERFFEVKVDSVQVTETIALGDTLILRFWGVVGSNGCYSFSSFESHLQSSKLDLTIWGKYTLAGVCSTVMVEMRGTKYSVVPTDRGLLQVVIHQPDGSALLDTVMVR